VHRLLLFACFQEVVKSLSRECASDEQLSRPPLLNLSAKDDVDFWLRPRVGFGKEKAPRLLILEALKDETMALVPRQTGSRELRAFAVNRNFRPRQVADARFRSVLWHR
jgi:hypothetical protein